MRTARVLAAVLLLGGSSVLFGQGSAVEQLEAVFKDMLGHVNQITGALRTVKDEETAAAAHPKLKKAAAGLQEVQKRSAALQKVPKDERDRLTRKYGDEVRAAFINMTKEVARVRDVPGGKEALDELTTPPPKQEK
jgi:hypothetical protein